MDNAPMHTPGPWVRMRAEPWTVENDDAYGHTYTGIGAENEHPIALVVAADYQSDGCFDANARLIAAAPDLLAALQGMLEAFGGFRDLAGNPVEEDVAARAAIAKATQ